MNDLKPPLSPQETNPLALTSIIAGVLGLTLLPFMAGIVAIITGHLARGEIRRNPIHYTGDNLAVIGLILGYISIVLSILGAIAFLIFIGGLAWLSFH